MPLALNQAMFSPVHAVGGYSHSQLLVRHNGIAAGVVLGYYSNPKLVVIVYGDMTLGMMWDLSSFKPPLLNNTVSK